MGQQPGVYFDWISVMNTPPFLPRYLLLTLCIAGGYSPFYHLYAAENNKDTDINDEQPIKLPVIEVTAEKVLKAERQNQQEMFNKPYSKQIISQEKIQQEGLPDIKEAIRDIPGVSITETGAFGKNVKIRGLTGQRVVSVVDGVKIANQGLDHSGSGEINQVDINNVEMIEVVKGSPAVIYDPGASGGVIIVKTKPVQMNQGIGVSQKFAYDEGYDKTSSTTSLNAGMENFGAKVTYTKESSNDYRVRGDADKKYAISKTNALNAVNSTVTVKDLGYDAESLSAKLSGKFATDSQIDLDYDQWIGKDIASAHGSTMQDAMIMLLARKERESKSITYRKDNLGIFNNFSFKYNKQSLLERQQEGGYTETLDSDNFNANLFLNWHQLKASFGLEAVLDKAVTAVYSEQDYYAGFTNLEYDFGTWTGFAGVRANYWATRQKLLPGANAELASQLIGISGITPEKTIFEPTWALGAQYHLTDTQNISANISRTFRAPDLYERYTFGGFLGGGLALQPEEGYHAEVAWKYLNDHWALNTSVFYSDFDQYIWTKTNRRVIDRVGLENCIRIGKCNIATGNFNDHESDFFQDTTQYYNANQVNNWGMELSANYMDEVHDFGISGSFNKIDSEDVFVQAAAHPIDINSHYKYTFSQLPLQPWVKGKIQTVFDEPQVIQKGGFDSYTIGSLYAGFNHKYVNLSAGIRNLGNTTYRAAYSGLNGLERTYFINAEFKWNNYK